MEAGRKVADVARTQGVSEAMIYTQKSKFGGLEASEGRRLKKPEDENRQTEAHGSRSQPGQTGAGSGATRRRTLNFLV
jgi:hypothetical protein